MNNKQENEDSIIGTEMAYHEAAEEKEINTMKMVTSVHHDVVPLRRVSPHKVLSDICSRREIQEFDVTELTEIEVHKDDNSRAITENLITARDLSPKSTYKKGRRGKKNNGDDTKHPAGVLTRGAATKLLCLND